MWGVTRKESAAVWRGRATIVGALVCVALAVPGCSTGQAISAPDVPDVGTAPPVSEEMVTQRPSDEPTAAMLATCTPGSLPTVTPGALTISTGSGTPNPPWFNDADPATGNGLAASIGTELARVLGYRTDNLRWAQPGKPADLTFRFDPDDDGGGDTPTDTSVGYFAVNDAVVIDRSRTDGLPPTGNTRLGFVKEHQSEWSARDFGAQSLVAFDTESDGLAALAKGRVDAMLVPLTSALALRPPLTAIAQVAPPGAYQADQLTLTLAPDSPLTACVNGALDRLRIEGTLAREAQRWINLPTLTSTR